MSDPIRAPRIMHVAKYPLGGEPRDDLSATTTAQERLAMMWPLAVEAWTVAGWSIPQYTRAEMPVRVRSRREPPSDR